jgi:hypothetical protein
MGLGIAIRAFSAALFNQEVSEKLREALEGTASAANLSGPETLPSLSVESAADSPAVSDKRVPCRSDAITLLSALQREARLVDLIQEDLTNYSDAQVGAAARPCLQSCASTLARFFSLAAVSDASEGATVEIGDNGSPARYQWIGEGDSTSGQLVHHGWQATSIDLPTWSGDQADANVIAPAQLQR